MLGLLAPKLAVGIAVGLAIGWLATQALNRIELPSEGLLPVATFAIAALAYGVSELIHGSGLLAVYLAALALGSANLPGKRIVLSFHQGVGEIAQIGLFILLGLLVFPSELGDVALRGLALSAVLILIARPLATFLATVLTPFNVREKVMLGWAGLRGATPIWLATFPVVAGAGEGREIFAVVFFVVVTSTLVQGASFEPLANRLGLTTDEPSLPQRLFESGRIRRMGGDVIAWRLPEGAAAAGHPVRDLELPREALVNVIVRDGQAIAPRGSTELEGGDELHILVRGEVRQEVEDLTKTWVKGPIGKPPPPPIPRRASSQIFSVRPRREDEDPQRVEAVDGVAVVAVLRVRRDGAGVMAALVDGRYAVTGPDIVAVGGRRALADWCEGRAEREGIPREEHAWWQEVTGALIARGRRR
jgi:cell volume regulation protein A